VWSANHFYYNEELFSCLLLSSLEAISFPPAQPVVLFGQPKEQKEKAASDFFFLEYHAYFDIKCTSGVHFIFCGIHRLT